ncbi:hypothetical protein [Actinophytocola sp.]|uniref:hypothetical protein n=1 Tax=Actinophytocola sp. TaxID=1872138 RepID=UPI002DDD899D|nr:hypothetical protein [Actinophytocola sp.]
MAEIRSSILAAADRSLRWTGSPPLPQVHMLVEDCEHPYAGHVVLSRRPRGDDPTTAVAGLGVLPAVLGATRVVVAWDAATLPGCRPAPSGPCRLVMVDADRRDHAVTRHVYDIQLSALSFVGVPGFVPRWRLESDSRRAPLPDPVDRLLTVWRHRWDRDVPRTVAALRRNGYRIHWSRPWRRWGGAALSAAS